VDRGMKEIKLTGQDTAAYGLDAERTSRPTPGVDGLPGEFRVRVAWRILDRVPDCGRACGGLPSGEDFKFLHLPVKVETIASSRPCDGNTTWRSSRKSSTRSVARTSDHALDRRDRRFPGEDEDQFERTMDLIGRIRPDIVNVTRFSPRAGTPAAQMSNQSSDGA